MKLPPRERWKCTFLMSEGLAGLKHRSLDDLLEYFNFERRGEDEVHGAVTDCELTAKVYMELVKKSEEGKFTLGFCRD